MKFSRIHTDQFALAFGWGKDKSRNDEPFTVFISLGHWMFYLEKEYMGKYPEIF